MRRIPSCLAALALLAGCGGFNPDARTVVTVSPPAAAADPEKTVDFSYTIVTPTDPSVVWSANGGSVTQGGLYTAPLAPGVYDVTVTSVAEPAAKATSVVAVGASNKGAVTPDAKTVGIGETVAFAATFTEVADQAAAWFATVGQVDAAGAFTAPTSPGSGAVFARSRANPLQFGLVKIAVSAISITITPDGQEIRAGAVRNFTAKVEGAFNKAVTWSASAGSITAEGAFTAPSTTGPVTITATSVANPTVKETATALIIP